MLDLSVPVRPELWKQQVTRIDKKRIILTTHALNRHWPTSLMYSSPKDAFSVRFGYLSTISRCHFRVEYFPDDFQVQTENDGLSYESAATLEYLIHFQYWRNCSTKARDELGHVFSAFFFFFPVWLFGSLITSNLTSCISWNLAEV